MTAADVLAALQKHKGEFRVTAGAIRHRTAKDAAGSPSCPLAFVCGVRGTIPHNSDFYQMAKLLDLPAFETFMVGIAADQAGGRVQNPYRVMLEAACL